MVNNSKQFQRLLLEVQKEGKNYVGQKSRVEIRSYDPLFVEKLEEGFSHLDAIIAAPRSFIKQDPTLMDAGRAKKINSETVTHLASHTQFVYDVDREGNVTPMKLLSIESDVDYWIYENRFVATLIKKAAIFIEKRVNYIKDHGETRDSDLLLLHTNTDIDGALYEVDSRIKLSTPSADEGNAERNEDLLRRLYSLRERCAYYTKSPFMELMKGSKPVANPIHQTNMIVKNPDYHAAYVLWQFLDSYTELGVSYEVTETEANYDDDYFNEIYALLAAEMLTLRSSVLKNRALKDLKKTTKKITPKVLFTLEDETFYDGKFLYDQFPERRPMPDTPLTPTPDEVHKERQHLRQKWNEDHIKKALVDDAIEQQKAKDIAEEAAQRLRKAEEEARRQEEAMRLAELEAKLKAEEEARRKEEELAKRRSEEERRLEAARRKVIRKAELDKLGLPYGVEEMDTHISDGYGAVSFYSGAAPLFLSPIRDKDEVRRENEARLAEIERIKRATPTYAIQGNFPGTLSPLKEPPAKPFYADINSHTFLEKLFLSNDEVTSKYRQLHEYIASFSGASSVRNSKGELTSFRRKAIVFLSISGKHIKLNLALDPASYEDSAMPVSSTKGALGKRLPLDFRVRSDLALRRAKALVDEAMASFGLGKQVYSGEEPVIVKSKPTLAKQGLYPTSFSPVKLSAKEEAKLEEEAKIVRTAPEFAPQIAYPGTVSPLPEKVRTILIKDTKVIEKTVYISKPVEASVVETNPVEVPTPVEAIAPSFVPEIKKTPFQEKYLNLSEEDELKAKFDGLRERALSYDVSERVSIKGDLFSAHRKRLVFLTLSGRHIKVSLALDPKAYQDSTLPVEENTSKKLSDTPLLFRVKSDLSYRRALSLIDEVFKNEGMPLLDTPKAAAPIQVEEKEAAPAAKEPKPEQAIVSTPEKVEEPVKEEQPDEEPAATEVTPIASTSSVPEIKKTPFQEKYANLDDDLKAKYDTLRYKAASYDVSERVSIKGDLFSAHRKKLVFLTISGHHIKVNLALNPKDYADSTMPVEENTSRKLADTPLLLRVRSDLSLKRALTLIEETMKASSTPLSRKEPKLEEIKMGEKAENPAIGEAPAIEHEKAEEPVGEVKPIGEAPMQEEDSPVVGEEASAKKSFVPEIKKATFFEKLQNIDPDLKQKLETIRKKACEYDCSERLSIKGDLYSAHRVRLLFIQLSGKHIKLNLALNPDDYQDSVLPVERNSSKKLEDTPMLFRVRSDLSCKRALSLVEEVMKKNDVAVLATPKTPAEMK